LSPKQFIAAAALAASVSLPLAALAQTPAGPPPAAGAPAQAGHHRGGHFMHALRSLNLSPDQKQQILSRRKDLQAANQNADPQTRRANVQQFRSQVDGILTPSQRQQFHTQLRNERRNAMPPGANPGGNPGANPPAPHA